MTNENEVPTYEQLASAARSNRWQEMVKGMEPGTVLPMPDGYDTAGYANAVRTAARTLKLPVVVRKFKGNYFVAMLKPEDVPTDEGEEETE